MEPIHSSRLVRKKKYIVHTPNGIYKGLYLTQPQFSGQFPYIVLKFVTKNGNKIPEAIFDRQDIFYHAEEYETYIKKKANQAREQMELRALDKILKQVVNDDFKWQ
jgi:hypothetical protein